MQLHYVNFGAGIKAARQYKKLSQRELSRQSGVGQSTISEVEAGKSDITIGTASKLTGAMGLRITVAAI